jgi:hypothetical protein
MLYEGLACHEFGPNPQNASSDGVARVSKGKLPDCFRITCLIAFSRSKAIVRPVPRPENLIFLDFKPPTKHPAKLSVNAPC